MEEDLISLVLATLFSFFYFIFLFFPGGALLLRRFFPEISPEERVVYSIPITSLVVLCSLAVFRLLSVPLVLQAWTLRLAFFLACVLWLRSGEYRHVAIPAVRKGLVLWFLAFFVALSTAAFPTASLLDVQPQTIQRLTGLPIDNLIPYHVARIFSEGLPFFAYEIVPDWAFTDRGPAAGMLSAAVMLSLGLKDNGLWLTAQPQVFFCFEAFLCWLNLFSLFVVFTLARKLISPQAAILSVAVLTSSYFYWTNVYFSWPKLFAAGVFLLGWSALRNSSALAGLLLSLSLLVHETVIFPLVILVVHEIWRAVREGSPTHRSFLLQTFASGLVVISPWWMFKFLASPPSGRLLYYQLFCFARPEDMKLDLFAAAERFLSVHSIGEILRVKFENIIYPYNILYTLPAYFAYWREPYNLFQSLSGLVFYQFIYAIGIPFFILSFMGFCRRADLRDGLLIALGSGIVSGLSFGCALLNVNHQWAYVSFLIFALGAGVAVKTKFRGLIFIFGVVSNIALLIICFYTLRPSVTTLATGAYVNLQAGSFLLLCSYLIFGFFKERS